MTARPIGYYVHHHGAGHLARARTIASAAAGRITLLGSGIGSLGIDLADDHPASNSFGGADGSINRPDALHYAPLDHEGVRSRVATLTRWIDVHKPSLMVVDVSVEVAMLARLASVPIVYVRLNGDRTDLAHLEAFRGAVGLLAPFHHDLEAASTMVWVREKTRYVPGICRILEPRSNPAEDVVLIVVGRGGREGDGEAIALAAAHSPNWRWRVIGPCTVPRNPPSNLEVLGWVDNPGQAIANAAVIVGAAGDGLVGQVLAADRPFICLPDDRPFDEQQATARGLALTRAAVVLSRWPGPGEWTSLIEEALALPAEGRQRLHDANGAHAAAKWLFDIEKAQRRRWEQAA